jgi:hypothetical protein
MGERGAQERGGTLWCGWDGDVGGWKQPQMDTDEHRWGPAPTCRSLGAREKIFLIKGGSCSGKRLQRLQRLHG